MLIVVQLPTSTTNPLAQRAAAVVRARALVACRAKLVQQLRGPARVPAVDKMNEFKDGSPFTSAAAPVITTHAAKRVVNMSLGGILSGDEDCSDGDGVSRGAPPQGPKTNITGNAAPSKRVRFGCAAVSSEKTLTISDNTKLRNDCTPGNKPSSATSRSRATALHAGAITSFSATFKQDSYSNTAASSTPVAHENFATTKSRTVPRTAADEPSPFAMPPSDRSATAHPGIQHNSATHVILKTNTSSFHYGQPTRVPVPVVLQPRVLVTTAALKSAFPVSRADDAISIASSDMGLFMD